MVSGTTAMSQTTVILLCPVKKKKKKSQIFEHTLARKERENGDGIEHSEGTNQE